MEAECKIEPTTIERYLDGELGHTESLHIQQHLETCSICQARAASLRLSSELLNEHLEKATQQADFTDFEQAVLQGIQLQQQPSLSQRLSVWLKESLQYHRLAWIAAAGAAVVLIMVALAGLWSSPLTPKVSTQKPAQAIASASKGTRTARVDNDVIIDQLDYQGKRSMIFTVSKNNTTVIWMYDFDSAGSASKEGDEI